MSYTHLEIEQEAGSSRAFSIPRLERLLRVVIWSIINAVLVFAEHLAEMVAPLLLLAGLLWWLIPHALDAIALEGQAADILQIIRSHVPHEIYLDGSYYSAGVLMTDAIWLVGVVAVCRTRSTTLAILLLDQR